MHVRLTNQPKEKQRLLEALRAFARDNQISDQVLQAADLALEEHLTNVMNYGYEDTKPHEILVRLEIVNRRLPRDRIRQLSLGRCQLPEKRIEIRTWNDLRGRDVE